MTETIDTRAPSPEAEEETPAPPGGPSRRARWPLVAVAAAVVFNLWVLRAEARSVWYPNDASVHRSMVAWAADRIEGGHLPLDGWYPDLALGSSRFHHYQSLPHILTGVLAIPLGSERAVAWTLYLLLSLWPISVYAGGRLLGWGRPTCALAALASPLVVSRPGLGFEWGSYVWRGYGTWAQLWGMWLLPFAWGLSWRAVDQGRSIAWAALVLALTVACHLLTGYLALLSLGVWVLVRWSGFLRRLGRAAVVGIGSLLIAAWVVVPLVADRAWTIQDEFSRNKPFYDSFGARQVLRWFVTGELFDRWRFPILTILLAVGLVVCVARLSEDVRARALLGVGLLSLVLFFGRPTLGPLLRLLPGSGDLFLRRFVFGVHLAGIYLIGIGLAQLGAMGRDLVRRWIPRAGSARVLAVAASVLTVLLLAPAWVERVDYESKGAWLIARQQVLDRTDGADVTRLVQTAARMGPGRVYAGMRSNWGSLVKVGQVPMYAVLLAEGVEGVGFTRPTWSLSSPAEYRFSDRNAAHYDLFDVRYVILPEGRFPLVPAEQVLTAGDFTLWEVQTGGYVDVVDVDSTITADRTNLGVKIAPWLRSDRPAEGLFPSIAFAGHPGAPSTLREGGREGPPGRVLSQRVDLRDGQGVAEVDLERRGMVVLKTSFDPRWGVWIDGEPAEPQMVAPSFVGRIVPAGRHEITFSYQPFPRYDLLLLVGALTFVALLLGPRWLRRLSSSRRASGEPD